MPLTDKEGQVFVNEGVLRAKTFSNRRLFKNMGSLQLGKWQQEGKTFTNSSEGSIEVSDETTFDIDQIDNQGSITLKGKSDGRIGVIRTNGVWLFKTAAKLKGEQILIGTRGILRAEDVFDWLGELVANEGKLFLFDNQIRATQQVINHNLIRWTHNAFKTWHLLNLGWMERSDQFDAPSPTFIVSTDNATTFKEDTVENRGVVKLHSTNYVPRMTLESRKALQWINSGSMEFGEQDFAAKSFHNTGELIFRRPVTGRIDQFESTGQIFTHSPFKITGQSFITSDKSFLESHGSFDLAIFHSLHMKGNWRAHQDFSLTASNIQIFGTIVNEKGRTELKTSSVVSSSVVNKGGKIHLATLAYEGTDFTNVQGQVQIGKLERKTSVALKVANIGAADEATRDETRKTKVHLLGGAKLDVINSALMVLAGGKYEITGIDNTNGRLEGDSITFDVYTSPVLSLAGVLVVDKLYGTNRLRLVSIKGKTTFISGGFRAQTLHILPSSQLSLGMVESDFDEVFNQGILKALPSMKVTTQKLRNKGSIESDTSLIVHALLKSDEYKKETTSTPLLVVQSHNQPIKGTKSFNDIILGLLRAKQDLQLHLSRNFDLATALYKFGKNWQCEGILHLKTSIFRVSQDIELGRRVQLEVEDYENDKYTLAFQSLRLLAKRFRHGKSNAEMAMFETRAAGATYLPHEHALEIIVDGDVDNRYGHIHGIGPTTLKSITGDVFVGTPKLKPNQPVCKTYCGDRNIYGYFDFKEPNGAFVESKDTLYIEGRHIKADYGDIYASKKATLKGRKSISSEGGQIFLQLGGKIETPSFLLTCADPVEYNFWREIPDHANCVHSGFPSDGAGFYSFGDVDLKTTSNRIVSSDFLCLGNVTVNGVLSNAAELFSLERASGRGGCDCPGCSGWHTKYHRESKFMGGKYVSIKAKKHRSFGGYLFGGAVELEGESYSSTYLGQAMQVFAQGYVVSALNAIRSLIAPGGRGAIQETNTGIAKRFPDRNARVLDEAKIAFMGRKKLGIPIGLKPYIAPELNPWALEMMLAEHLRMFSIPGETVDIFQTMTTRSQHAALSGALMSQQDLNRQKKSLIYFDLEEVRPGVQEPILQLYIALEERKLIAAFQAALVAGTVNANFRGKTSLTGSTVQALDENDTKENPALRWHTAEFESDQATHTERRAIDHGERKEQKTAAKAGMLSAGYGEVIVVEGDLHATATRFAFAKGGRIGAEKGNVILDSGTLNTFIQQQWSHRSGGKRVTESHFEHHQTFVPTEIEMGGDFKIFAGDDKTIYLHIPEIDVEGRLTWKTKKLEVKADVAKHTVAHSRSVEHTGLFGGTDRAASSYSETLILLEFSRQREAAQREYFLRGFYEYTNTKSL